MLASDISIRCRVVLFFIVSVCLAGSLTAQSVAVGFYNLENFFDTLNDPHKNDNEFTPRGSKHYNAAVYGKKLNRISEVIASMDTGIASGGLALLGVAEVENAAVLKDICNARSIRGRNYQSIHYDSPDERGIDVALLYRPADFKPLHSQALHVDLGPNRHTRDILWVTGVLQKDTVHVLVNHWSSRAGGQSTSAISRNKAASVCRHLIDSLMVKDAGIRCIVLGDMNDNPMDESCRLILRTSGLPADIKAGITLLYNPCVSLYEKGQGTEVYRNHWNFFDQVMVSANLLHASKGFVYESAGVYVRPFMVIQKGNGMRYPFRFYTGNTFNGGYSDHFPVYLILKYKG